MKQLTLALIILGFGFNLIFGQSRLSDQVEQNLIFLGRKIEQIRVLAERYKNQEALKTIQSAKEDFDNAIDLLKQWKDNRGHPELLEQARAKYQSANLKADLASRLLLFKPAVNLMNQLDRLIQKAENLAQGSDENDLRYYLNKARNFYRQAKNAFSENRYLRGHEYLKIATYFAEKVISLARKGNGSETGEQRFEEYRNNIRVLLNRVEGLIDDDVLQELYDNVQDYLRRADNAYSQGNLNRALINLQIAERLTHRIIDLAEDTDNSSVEQRVENDYQSLGRYLAAIRNELESQNTESAIFDKANELYLQAGRNLNNGKYQQAAFNLKLAQRMALRAFNRISAGNNSPDSEHLRNRLNELNQLIQLQQQRVNTQQNKSSHVLFDKSKEYLLQAQQEYENHDFDKAAFYINLSLRLLNTNEKILKSQNTENITSDEINQDLRRVEQLVTRLKQNTSLSADEQAKISVLEDLLGKAGDAFTHKNFIIAREILSIIKNQLTSMPNK